MRNLVIVVKPDETATDIIEQICLEENIRPDDYFAFSCIMTGDKLKINCVEENNPYTPRTLVNAMTASAKVPKYVMPPLELYLETYKPLIHKIVSDMYSYYERLIPDKDEHLSILYYVITKLYKQGYYLHNHLIRRSFRNELNLEVRKLKGYGNIQSLDEEIGQSEDGQTLIQSDLLECPISTEEARRQFHYTEDDYWEDMLDAVKSYLLETISQLRYDRLLIQLKTKTLDRQSSGLLMKCREKFNPSYSPRPNHHMKKRGTK